MKDIVSLSFFFLSLRLLVAYRKYSVKTFSGIDAGFFQDTFITLFYM